MQEYRIEVGLKEQAGELVNDAKIYSTRLYFLAGNLSDNETGMICSELLADPVTEIYSINRAWQHLQFKNFVDVTLHPGVTDPAAESLKHAISLLGIDSDLQVATGQRYLLETDSDINKLHDLAIKVFSNPVIQRYSINEPIPPPFVVDVDVDDTVEIIDIKDADDNGLMQISKTRRLSLDIHEMRAIRDYFMNEGRNPTDAELEMLAQTWSEHCVHKTFKARVSYTGPIGPDDKHVEKITIDGLLKTYIRAATEKVNKPWVYSAFVDDAGIIKFDDHYDLAFKVETHNRPSALEPFGGANTGVGGVIRDVLGVSARPIANTDVLCFGPPDIPSANLPNNVLHPQRIANGVIAGIEDYGNKMGIPTVNGAIVYHKGYISNPLVFCGCVGILPHNSHKVGANAGDLIIVIGGRTGRDGLRGATFSSMEMDTTTSAISGGAVQIGHPINEKRVQEVVILARDAELYTAITDCGAGGLSSSVGEMGAELGATVQLADIPLKYQGLQPWEIWLSEAQERMVLAVPPGKWEHLQQICSGQDVEAVCIGTFESTGRLKLYYNAKLVGDISMDFLHDGIPQKQLAAEWIPKSFIETDIKNENFAGTLLQILSMPTIRSKEDVIRQYDHEVQGGTSVKPLVGVDNHGPSDASVIVPYPTQKQGDAQGVAIANGISPSYAGIDPYAMAWATIDEAVRNVVAVGGDPDQIAVLDNFCWGNTSLPDRLGSLVRCAQGCYDAALAYAVPFISGKDSLNNEYLGDDGQRHSIPGTLLISAIGIVPDISKTITMDLKSIGNHLYLIGETRDEMGGSHYNILHNLEGGTVARPVPDALKLMRSVYQAIHSGLIRACHDLSEGGLGVAIAEMCIAGHLGAKIQIKDKPSSTLFSESSSRFIVEVADEHILELEALLNAQEVKYTHLGVVTDDPILYINNADDDLLIAIPVSDLEISWRGSSSRPSLSGNLKIIPQYTQAVQFNRQVSVNKTMPKILILHANGTNRDHDAYLACELAGGDPEIVHVNQLFKGERNLLDYHMLVIPGGFSYGDDLGAGVLWALDLRKRLGDNLEKFISSGRPVLGICNGFQTLVKSGLLPGKDWALTERNVTLTYNQRNQFECRWVYLKTNPHSHCLFTQDIDELLYVPVAHGEGRFVTKNTDVAKRLWQDGLVALNYVDEQGALAGYPYNPNGSVHNIAGICNPEGNVFGLMPHPENHIFDWQHPRQHRGESGMLGLKLFKNGIKYV